MIELTYDKTVELLNETVQEFGEDYVYSRNDEGRCVYVQDGQPSCLVGHVLVKAGVPLERLEAADSNFGGTGADVLIRQINREGAVKVDGKARTALAEAQYTQDHGNTWGLAVRRATRWAEHVNS